MKRMSLAAACLLVAAILAVPAANAAETAASGQKGAPAKTPAVVDSLALLERAVGRDSSNFDNLYRLGLMYLDRDKSDEAIKVFSRASTLRKNDVKTLVNLGAAYDAKGSSGAAQLYYRSALKAAPGDSVAMCRLASSLYATSNVPEAVELLRTVIREKPNAYCAYFTMGVAFADAGIYRDAIRMWRKVIALAPQSPEAISATESIEVLERYVNTTR